jgi:hypothetical protein
MARPSHAAPVAWPDEPADGAGLMARAEPHTSHARFCRAAGTTHPTRAAINVAGCQAPGVARRR